MYRVFGSFMICLFLASVYGCNEKKSENLPITSNDEVLNRIDFYTSKGIQTDVFNQRVEVIDDGGSYNEFLLSIPSMNGEIPSFEENSETMVGIISNAESCIFSPIVTGVKEFDATIIISILNNPSSIPEQAVCDPLPFEFYAYNLVTIKKMNKPISIVFDNPSSFSCDSPINVSGGSSVLLLISVKDNQDVDAIATEYKNIYGSDITIHRVFENNQIFSAEMADTVLLKMRCDERIKDIEYDEPVSVAS